MLYALEKLKPLAFLSLVAVGHASTDKGTQVVLQIDRMMCASCTSRVKKTIESHTGTSDVSVRLEDHRASFSCAKIKDAKCDLDKIVKSLRKIGFPPKVVSK